jgi:hypothetical protein
MRAKLEIMYMSPKLQLGFLAIKSNILTNSSLMMYCPEVAKFTG